MIELVGAVILVAVAVLIISFDLMHKVLRD